MQANYNLLFSDVVYADHSLYLRFVLNEKPEVTIYLIHMSMKKQLLLLIIACSAFMQDDAHAQTTMQVYDRAGTIDSYTIFNVRKITFDSSYTMTVHEINTNKNYYAIDTIRKIIFNSLPTSNPEVLGGGKSLKVYPNPASNVLVIEYSIEKPEQVVLQIFNIYGVMVKEKIENTSTGTHKYVWDRTNSSGDHMASGTYICHVSIGGKRLTEKIILIH